MWHPYKFCPIRYCCCCMCDPEVTCFVIGAIEIINNVFSGVINFGVGHWSVYLATIANLLIHLLAGILLIMGALWGKPGLKVAYCWISFVLIFLVVAGFAAYCITHDDDYIIWRATYKRQEGAIYLIVCTLWLLIWNIYTPMVVAGNMEDEDL